MVAECRRRLYLPRVSHMSLGFGGDNGCESQGSASFFVWFQHFSSSFFFFFNFDGFVSEISPVIVRMFFFASESGYVNLGISEIIFKYYF